ncbi:MAG: hypothetical protein CMM87_02395 [Rickettsiales bacterium]|nr:hypothetical protein [Rickettsiales bacterium]
MSFLKNYNSIILDKLKTEIDWFLEKNCIHHFSYQRFYDDGRHLSIFNNTVWSEFYFESLNENSIAFIDNATGLDPTTLNLRLWPTTLSDNVVSALHHYNIWNGASLYQKCPDGLEAWEFAGTKEDTALSNFYLTKQHLLKQFIAYLKPRIEHLINPHDVAPVVSSNISSLKTYTPKQPIWIEMPEKLNCIGLHGPVTLSSQETKAVFELKKGRSAKQIADTLNLSPKTVEEYLSNIRRKLGVIKNTHILILLEGGTLDYR